MNPQLHWQNCTICGTRFQGLQRQNGVNVFCSDPCRNVGKRSYMRNIRGVPLTPMELTSLNRETTLRWLACLAAGTHRPGETFTATRSWRGHEAPMPTCDTCSVPFPDMSVGWRLSGSEAA